MTPFATNSVPLLPAFTFDDVRIDTTFRTAFLLGNLNEALALAVGNHKHVCEPLCYPATPLQHGSLANRVQAVKGLVDEHVPCRVGSPSLAHHKKREEKCEVHSLPLAAIFLA